MFAKSPIALPAIDFSLLAYMFCFEFIRIDFEELNWLLWMLARYIMECQCRDIVRLSFADKQVVFQQILNF
jgi:hypothetical protein